MWRFRVGKFAIAVLLAFAAAACGGRARIDGSADVPPASAGTSDPGVAGAPANTSAGGSMPSGGDGGTAVAQSGGGGAIAAAGAGTVDADSDFSNSCPQDPNNRACPTTEIDLVFAREMLGPRTGIWVEPLQIPDYRQGPPANLPEVEPSKWDRSPLPAGSCVLRIHGLSGACLQRGLLFVGTCASLADPDVPHIVPFGYYEGSSCQEGVAPGCPSADASDWRNGNWWYLVARGDDTDLVVCAPQCATPFALNTHACLRSG